MLGQRPGVRRLGRERVEDLIGRGGVRPVKGDGAAALGLILNDSPPSVLNQIELVEERLAAFNGALCPVGAALRAGPVDGEAEAGGSPGFAQELKSVLVRGQGQQRLGGGAIGGEGDARLDLPNHSLLAGQRRHAGVQVSVGGDAKASQEQ